MYQDEFSQLKDCGIPNQRPFLSTKHIFPKSG